MKRLSLVLFIILFPAICFASLYFSPFGFTVNIPNKWEVVNSKKVMEDRGEALTKVIKRFDFLPEKERQEVIRRLKNGEAEYWCHEGGGNVNIQKADGTTVLKRSQFGEFKKGLSKEYPGVILHDIDLKKIGGCDAFYCECSGVLYGFRSLIVQVQINPNEYLVVTLTGSDDRFEGLKKEFWNIMSTFKPF